MSKNTPKTEQIFKKSKPIDHLSSAEAISLMIEEQQNASIEVKKSANSIEIAVEAIHSNLIKNPNGRLIYVGAGTSGRIEFKMVWNCFQLLIGQRRGLNLLLQEVTKLF